MGRKRQAQQRAEEQRSSPASSASMDTQEPRGDLETILSLPRILRMGLVILPTFAVVVILQPIIDMIYLRYLFTLETRSAASLITAAVALVYFLAGWLLIVGNVGERPPERRIARAYLYVSIGVLLCAVLWAAYLFFTNLRLQL